MINLSRRRLLRALPVSAAALALPAVVEAAAPTTAAERLAAAIEALKVAAAEVYPDIGNWRVALGNAEGCPLLVAAFAPVAPPSWDGPGRYEFRHHHMQPVAFLDRAAERDSPLTGRWFWFRHYYGGRFQGRRVYLPESEIRIVRKVEALG